VPAAARRAREWLEHVLRSVPGADPAPDLPALLAVLSGDDAGA